MTAATPGTQSRPIDLVQRPSMALLGLEPWRATYELVRSALSSTEPVVPPGDGHRVIVFPGLCSSTWAIAPMIRLCRRLGYDAHDWGRGMNTGPGVDVDPWLRELAAELRVEQGAAESVTLVGWSLGGLYAREIAKLAPSKVRQVVTIGTPFNADADYTRVGWLFNLLSGRRIDFDGALVQRLRTPPPLPTTSIYTRQDGVVAWQTCTHHKRYPCAEDVEVVSSHLGMGWNPAVMSIVTNRLAQVPGQWRPYQGAVAAAERMRPAFARQRS